MSTQKAELVELASTVIDFYEALIREDYSWSRNLRETAMSGEEAVNLHIARFESVEVIENSATISEAIEMLNGKILRLKGSIANNLGIENCPPEDLYETITTKIREEMKR